MKKIIRITTSAGSLRTLLKGQLRFMNKYFDIVGIGTGEKTLEQVRENEGVRTINLNMTRTISPLKDLVAVYSLYKILKVEKPFIVHTHTPKAGIVGMLAAKLAGVKHRLHTVAGMPLLEATGFKRKILDLVEKFTYQFSTLVLPNSFAMQEIIIKEKYTTQNKLKVIGNGSSNGIDTNYFNPELVSKEEKYEFKKSLGINEKDIVFISIGRIVADKGINELVKAYTKLIKTKPNCKLLIIGPCEAHLDPLKDETNDLIESTESILLLGRQSNVRLYLAISDVLTFPSYREGFPNVVLEACAMNLPCIVTNINGCNEIIDNYENGIIIPVKDDEAIKEAMIYMIDNPTERKQMSLNSREKIVKNYQRQYIWDEILKQYKSLEQ
jgi:glycosyltransferase involved in cell wall biosynthesis